jgi:hypothetical protein
MNLPVIAQSQAKTTNSSSAILLDFGQRKKGSQRHLCEPPNKQEESSPVP